MYGSELRTCGLGAVVCVLLGAGIGYGWHYLDNGGGRAAVASTVAALAQQDAPSGPPSTPAPQGGTAVNVPQVPGVSHYSQPAQRQSRCAKGHTCGKHQRDQLAAGSPQG